MHTCPDDVLQETRSPKEVLVGAGLIFGIFSNSYCRMKRFKSTLPLEDTSPTDRQTLDVRRTKNTQLKSH